MGEEENGLSDEEYDALLQDLEGRASEGSQGGGAEVEAGDDGEDIDAFLQSLESDAETSASSSTATATDEDDELASQFAGLEQEGELTAPDESGGKKAGKGASKKSGKKADKGDSGQKNGTSKSKDTEPSKGRRVALAVAKNALWVVPALALWWVLGIYLAQWVSAGWLIALMSALVVGAVPAVGRHLVDRGGYRAWLGGFSLVATVALVAPMPNLAADKMGEYGHWPSSAIAELAGQPADAGIVNGHAAMSAWVGDLISTTDQPVAEARQLGTIFPLDMDWPPQQEVIQELEGVQDITDIQEGAEQGEGAEQQEQGQPTQPGAEQQEQGQPTQPGAEQQEPATEQEGATEAGDEAGEQPQQLDGDQPTEETDGQN